MDASEPKHDKQVVVNASLRKPIAEFSGVGSDRAGLFHKLGIRRGQDLLYFFPRDYLDIAPTKSAAELVADVRCSVCGIVDSIDARSFSDGRSSFGALMQIEGGGFMRLVWYNQPFRREKISRGLRLVATGAPRPTGISWEMRHPEFVVLGKDQPLPTARPMPIYPLTEGLQQRHIQSVVERSIDDLLVGIEDALPESFRTGHDIVSINDALRMIHLPSTVEQADRARRRFIFQELLVYQLALATRRHRLHTDSPSPAIAVTGQIHARILRRFGFELTNDQLKAIDEISASMNSNEPMNRLVQGDVGSGKTVIAQYAMLLAVANRYQATFMAPTEILAKQHAKRMIESLEGSQCSVELLTSSIPAREKRDLLERIALGTVDIVIGTQALLSDRVQFANLGLAVIDEQHKFGVEQRAALCDGRTQPHYLVLSATPIPRTLTMTAMGDMEVSILREKPPGRAPVHTYLGKAEQVESWWKFVRKQIETGRQAYVVTPRVMVEEDEDAAGAEQVFKSLQSGPLVGLRLGILHGRMDGFQKDKILTAFQDREIDVLVATTVIEVGIDVSNATVMTILDADRLGLAQLHQLRGRIARSSFPGYVCVFASKGAAADENTRLAALASTDDGFKLAEMDWQMRGPGNLLGTSQSGLPPFKIADLVRDKDVVEQTHTIARNIIDIDPNLDRPEWSRIRKQVFSKHGDMLQLGSVG